MNAKQDARSARRKARNPVQGVAVGVGVLWGVVRSETHGSSEVFSWTLPSVPFDEGSDLEHEGMAAVADSAWDRWRNAVIEALAELRSHAVAGERTRLPIALLPPLLDVRRVEMPRLRDVEARQVLARNVRRYFPAVHQRQTVAVSYLHGKKVSPVPVLVAAAPEQVLEVIRTAAVGAGWAPADVVPAHVAWSRAACSRWPEVRGDAARVRVTFDEVAYVLELEGGRLVGVRRKMASASGSSSTLHDLEHASVSAAAYAGVSSPLALVPEGQRNLRRRTARRRSGQIFAAAMGLVVVAGGFELWGAARELDAADAYRHTLAPVVSQALTVRSQVNEIEDRLDTLAALEGTAPRWSHLVEKLARRLPRDAYLTSLRGTRDTVILEGVAAQAAGVFGAVRGIAGVTDVRARAPIRREVSDGSAVERFSLELRLDTTVWGEGQ